MSAPLPYDPQVLADLQAINPDDGGTFVVELIDLFLRDTPLTLAELERDLAAADHAAASRHAHSIKGSSGNFGATALMEMAKEMELAAKAGDLHAASARLPELKARYRDLETALREFRRSLSETR